MRRPFILLNLLLSASAVFAAPPPAPPAAATNAPPARLDILVRKNINKNKTSSETTQESYVFQVAIRNEEPSRAFKDLSSELYVLTVDKADESMFNLVVRQADSFELPVRGQHEFSSSLFYVRHTDTSGSELGGYIVVVTDETGRVLATKASRPSLEKNLDRIRGAPVSTSRRKAFRLE